MYANELNADAAPAYEVVNLRAGYERQWGRTRVSAFVRVDNVTGRRYAGSVIVNEGNGRFFEPAPGRTWLGGLSITP